MRTTREGASAGFEELLAGAEAGGEAVAAVHGSKGVVPCDGTVRGRLGRATRNRRRAAGADARSRGLDLGPVDNAEIAVAELADLVARCAGGQVRAATTATPREGVDAVCGMTVFIDQAKYHTVHNGSDYWFCAPGCLQTFEGDPDRYVAQCRCGRVSVS